MTTITKLIHQGEYVVAVEVERVEPVDGWGDCITLDDSLKLDDTRKALQDKDLKKASQYGTLYRLTKVAV